MEKERDYRLDWLRVIAISMIVLMHSPKPDVIVNGTILSAISYLTAPGLVLFFMISGSLLLGSTLNTRDFFKRRFSKILWPTLFWTLFYLVTFVFTNSVPISRARIVLMVLLYHIYLVLNRLTRICQTEFDEV